MIKDVEKRLAEYRAAKLSTSTLQLNRREVTRKPTSENLQDERNPKVKIETKKEKKANISKSLHQIPVNKETLDLNQQTTTNSTTISLTKTDNFFGKYKREIDIFVNLLKFILWLLLMTVFVEVEFGAVFFICSIFYLIFRNFRSGPKKEGEPSAYSVFNPNCEAIDGTLTAEQFERELLHGPKPLQ